MSRIYKSSNVTIGTPKPIINTFFIEQKREAEEAEPAKENEIISAAEESAESIIEDAKQMYLKIIEEANSEARTVLESAEAEAQKLLAESKENGYREGYESGYIEGLMKAQSIIDEAAALKEFLDKRKEEIYKEAEEQVLQLVLEIAKKVIGIEISQNKEAVVSLVNQALQKCTFKKELVLKVSPQDLAIVAENKDRICKMVEGISDIEIIPDASLDRGSCIVETASGEVNSSIDVQTKEIERVFAYLLRNE